MTTFAVTMVKDESDVIAAWLERMLRQVDHVLVADNGSTDGTREFLEESISDCLTLIDDPEVGYLQSEKMSALAAQAATMGADWVIAADADEVWLAKDGRRIADVLAELVEPVAVAEMFNHYATGEDEGDDPISRMSWRTREPLSLPKVAVRPTIPVTIAQGNHTATYPSGWNEGLLEIRHFPYRSPEQFVTKAVNGNAAYRATNLDRSVGQHWREYGENIEANGEQAGHDWFNEHFYFASPADERTIVFDPCP